MQQGDAAQGIPMDEKRAIEYYSKPGLESVGLPLNNKGHILMSSEQHSDYKAAKECLETAFKLGYKQAGYNLFCLYAQGLGVTKDMTQAIEYLLLCDKNGDCDDEDVLLQLGVAYHKGLGLEQDVNKARHYYERSYKLGNAAATVNLAVLKINDFVVLKKPYGMQDWQEIYDMLKVSAEKGYSIATLHKNLIALILDPKAIPSVVAELKASLQVKPHKRTSEVLQYLEGRREVTFLEICAFLYTQKSLAAIEDMMQALRKEEKIKATEKPKAPDLEEDREKIQSSSKIQRLEEELDWFTDPLNRKSVSFKDFNRLMGKIIQLDEIDGGITRSKSSNVSYLISENAQSFENIQKDASKKDSKHGEQQPLNLHFKYHPTHSSGSGQDAKKDPKRTMKKQQFVREVRKRVFS